MNVDPNVSRWPARQVWAWALLFAAIAGLLRVALADQRGLWLHEYYTLQAIEMETTALVHNRLQAGHSPLPFLFEKLALVLGHSKRALRSTSALSVSLTVLFLTGLLESLGLRRCLPAFWGLAVFSPFWLTLGTELRYMMLLIAVASAAAWAAALYAAKPSWRSGLLLTALSALTLWVHSSAQFVVFALLLYVIWSRWMNHAQHAPDTPTKSQARSGRHPNRGIHLRHSLRDAWPLYLAFAASFPLLFLVRGHAEDTSRNLPNLDDLIKNLCEVAFGHFRFWPDMINLPYEPWMLVMVATLVWTVVLARRHLLRAARGEAWRLLFSLLIGIPVAVILTSALVRDVQGHIRYIVSLSIPAILLLAVAWNAPASRRTLLAYRSLVVLIFSVQLAGAALNRGDRHEETVFWICQNRQPGDTLFLTSETPNTWAFDYLGCVLDANVASYDGSSEDLDPLVDALYRAFSRSPNSRGFILGYHGKAPVQKAVDRLKRDGFFDLARAWNISELVQVFAVIQNPQDRDWLQNLPDPPHPFGPSRTRE